MAKIIEGNPWTEEEKELLKEIYPYNTKEYIMSYFPDRTWKAINGAANRYKIRKENAVDRWTREEENLLISHYETSTTEELLKMFPNRDISGICHKSSRLGLRKYEKHKDERTIWTTDIARKVVEDAGYKYIDTYIENHHRFLAVVCEEDHKTNIPAYNFENGQRCSICSGKYKRPYNEVSDLFKQDGYVMLTDESEYENTAQTLNVICPVGHPTTSTYSSFKSGARCQKCWFEKIGESKLLEFEYVKTQYKEHGFELFDHQLYEGIHTKLNCKCMNHMKQEMLSLSYYQVVHSAILCPYCVEDERIIAYRNSYLETLEAFRSFNLDMITSEDSYVKMRIEVINEKIVFICKNHSHHGTQDLNVRTIMRTRDDDSSFCRYCAKDSIRGENHVNWKGGISRISEYLRGKIQSWKDDSFINSKYKCEITGISRDLIIHHIHPFSEIVKETLLSLSFPSRSVGDYTKDELDLIEEKCLSLHYKYGLGACLNTDVHDIFHTIYSVHNFTKEDYYEFKIRYMSGEFEEVS